VKRLHTLLVLFPVILIALIGCSHPVPVSQPAAVPVTYVLVHGAWHGAWCWDKVVPLLEKNGNTVVAVDLPGHGKDKTPLAQVTLKAYVDRVLQVLDAQPGPVVLVGHSMGGIVITQAAESRPEKISTLVYLAATLPRNGESANTPAYAEYDPGQVINSNVVLSADKRSCTIRDEGIKECFYGDCSDADIERAKSLLVPQSLLPFITPVRTTTEKFGSVPRVYIATLRDKAIPPALQEYMYTNLPCKKVISMDTCHSPFFSQPEELVRNLLSVQ